MQQQFQKVAVGNNIPGSSWSHLPESTEHTLTHHVATQIYLGPKIIYSALARENECCQAKQQHKAAHHKSLAVLLTYAKLDMDIPKNIYAMRPARVLNLPIQAILIKCNLPNLVPNGCHNFHMMALQWRQSKAGRSEIQFSGWEPTKHVH